MNWIAYVGDARFWGITILSCVTLGYLASFPRTKGKSLIVLFLVFMWISFAGYYVPGILMRTKLISSDAYRNFINSPVIVVFHAAAVGSFGLLLAYVLTLRPSRDALYRGEAPETRISGNSANWYFEVLKKYAEFGGRARRKEYWLFTLFNIIIAVVLGLIDGAAGLASQSGLGPMGGLYTLAVLIPSLAVTTRRLHDTNHSGWWLLIPLVPLIGAIVLLVFMVQDSQQSENQYGPNPKIGPIAAVAGT